VTAAGVCVLIVEEVCFAGCEQPDAIMTMTAMPANASSLEDSFIDPPKLQREFRRVVSAASAGRHTEHLKSTRGSLTQRIATWPGYQLLRTEGSRIAAAALSGTA
jgi:hypothetical protein